MITFKQKTGIIAGSISSLLIIFTNNAFAAVAIRNRYRPIIDYDKLIPIDNLEWWHYIFIVLPLIFSIAILIFIIYAIIKIIRYVRK